MPETGYAVSPWRARPWNASPRVDADLELLLLAAEERHYWFRGRRLILDQEVRSLPLPPRPRLLDVGCGGGRFLEDLARIGEVSAVEPSATSLAVARARGVADLHQAPVEALPFPESSFDAITCLDVIEHVSDDVAGFAAMRRVARPGGFLVVTVPAYAWLWGEHDRVNHHHRRYSRRTLLERATRAGWAPIRTSYFNAALLLPAAAYRLVERLGVPVLSRASTEILTAPRPSLNRLLEQPLRLEARLLRAGWRLPFGLSLLGLFRATEQRCEGR